jgi:protein-S-isoprenylcysteine O-methyltransferase Ste14
METLENLQSIAILLVLVALAFAPWVWRKAKEADARRKELNGREMVAYLLYAEHCRGDRASLEHYERSAYIRAPWLAEADKRMAGWPNA